MVFYLFEIGSKNRIYEAVDLIEMYSYIQHNLDEFKDLFLEMIHTNSQIKLDLNSIYGQSVSEAEKCFCDGVWSATKNNITRVLRNITAFDFFHKIRGFNCDVRSPTSYGIIGFRKLDTIKKISDVRCWRTLDDFAVEKEISGNRKCDKKTFMEAALNIVERQFLESHQDHIKDKLELLWTIHKETHYL